MTKQELLRRNQALEETTARLQNEIMARLAALTLALEGAAVVLDGHDDVAAAQCRDIAHKHGWRPGMRA